MKMERLVISCGGTGGHFYPGLSVAREFQAQGGQVLLLLGGKHAVKQSATAQSFGIRTKIVSARSMSGNPVKMLLFAGAFVKGFFQSLAAFRKEKAQALLVMGSFASFPPAVAACAARIPLFLHDGNAHLGKTNRLMGPYAKAIGLAFPTTDPVGCPAIQTGMPLRQELLAGRIEKAQAVKAINEKFKTNFDPANPLLLVFGGSLGASSINNSARITPDLDDSGLQLIHLSGPGKMEELKEYYKERPLKHLLLEASGEIHLFYSAADMILCRAGGSTVAETACFGKFTVLIPYPYAMQDHQTDNARYLCAAPGAVMISDKEFTPAKFRELLDAFLKDPASFAEKGRTIEALAYPDASSRVLKMIETFLPEK